MLFASAGSLWYIENVPPHEKKKLLSASSILVKKNETTRSSRRTSLFQKFNHSVRVASQEDQAEADDDKEKKKLWMSSTDQDNEQADTLREVFFTSEYAELFSQIENGNFTINQNRIFFWNRQICWYLELGKMSEDPAIAYQKEEDKFGKLSFNVDIDEK